MMPDITGVSNTDKRIHEYAPRPYAFAANATKTQNMMYNENAVMIVPLVVIYVLYILLSGRVNPFFRLLLHAV